MSLHKLLALPLEFLALTAQMLKFSLSIPSGRAKLLNQHVLYRVTKLRIECYSSVVILDLCFDLLDQHGPLSATVTFTLSA
ncbi:MAG: hypothetical protein Q8S43_06395 [Actinomycetota bacterium]|nr:hypothetical protein [Actinomycetota bacterium]